VFGMDLNDSTQGPMMVFCKHLETVSSTKLGSFFTSHQYSRKILHPGAIYIAPTKKIPMDRGGDDPLASSILPTVLLPSPLVC